MVLAQLSTFRFPKLYALVGFHPTMVLAQPKFIATGGLMNLCFHPTLVLAQHLNACLVTRATDPFPSHIGSRSTRSKKSSPGAISSFHPTLVLAQHVDSYVGRYVRRGFHPTLVLAQRRPLGLSCSESRFHPTLVLAQRGGNTARVLLR